MLNSSQDILYLAIALAVLSLAGFSSWAIYYLARILQQGFRAAKEMRERLGRVDALVKSIKEKVDSSASYLLLIGEGVKKLAEAIRQRGEKQRDE